MLISVFTGFLAGGIHVISGADHLIAMAPSAIRRPGQALRGGLQWGLGHSMGVIALSSGAVLIKDLTPLERMSSWAELAIGVSLLIVGVLAIRASLGLNIHSHHHNHNDGSIHEHLHLHFYGQKKHARHSHALTSLGLLHGLAGASHLIAVIPALALPPVGAIAYMITYLIGSLLAMSIFVLLLSIATLQISQKA